MKTGLHNSLLFILSLIFTLAIGEWLFPKFLNKVPFRLYGGIETNLRVLAQYSKQSIFPENYIAILGDSNSVGVGDLYLDLSKNSTNWYPDYAPAHFINKKLGIDVVSFGFAGAGSLDGIWSNPVNQFNYINSKGLVLQPPKTILIFFYEGNDLGNNLQFLRKNYKGNEKVSELLSSAKFDKWLNQQFQNSIEEYGAEFGENLIFIKFLIKSVKNIFSEKSKKSKISETATSEEKLMKHIVVNGTTYSLVDSSGSIIFPVKSISHVVINGEAFPVSSSSRISIPGKTITQTVMNGKAYSLPGNLQAPPLPLGLRPIDIKRGVFNDILLISYFVFEEAIKRIKEKFPNSDLKIIYLPSVASSYNIVSPLTSVTTDMGMPGIVDTKTLLQKHLEVCRGILNISQKLKVSFFDTTGYLRKASSKGYIHGPKDWDHLNELGYRAFSDSISHFILHPDESYQNCTN